MPLASGTRLGPYDILSPMSASGMSEVNKERDTKLDRAGVINFSKTEGIEYTCENDKDAACVPAKGEPA